MVVGRRNCWKISRRGSYINVSLPSVPYARRRHRRRGTPRRAPPRPKRPAGQAAGSGGTRRHRAAQPRRAARHGPEPPPHLRLPPPGAAAARPGAPAPQGALGGASAFCLSPAGGRRQLPALSAAAGAAPPGAPPEPPRGRWCPAGLRPAVSARDGAGQCVRGRGAPGSAARGVPAPPQGSSQALRRCAGMAAVLGSAPPAPCCGAGREASRQSPTSACRSPQNSALGGIKPVHPQGLPSRPFCHGFSVIVPEKLSVFVLN